MSIWQRVLNLLQIGLSIFVVVSIFDIAFAGVKPSEEEAVRMLLGALQERFQDDSNLLKVNEAKKTDGEEVNFGETLYIMYFDADLEFLNNTFMCYAFLGRKLLFGSKCQSAEERLEFKAGSKLTISGEITFKKFESGWRVVKTPSFGGLGGESVDIDGQQIVTKLLKSVNNPKNQNPGKSAKMVSARIDKVRVLSDPEPSASSVAVLSKGSKVEFIERSVDRFWVKVKLPDGTIGWCVYNQIEE